MKTYDLSQNIGTEMSKIDIKYSGKHSHDTETKVDDVNVESDNVTKKPKETFFQRNARTISKTRNFVFLLLFLAYYSYAMYCNFGDEPSIRLTVFTGFGLSYIGWNAVLKVDGYKQTLTSVIRAICTTYRYGRRPKVIRWFLYLVWTVLLVTYLVINVALRDPGKLRSLGGFAVFILLLVFMSDNRRQINWHCVFWGTAVQCLIGYFIIKSETGRTVIMWFSDRLEEFMNYSNVGSKFAFGNKYLDHPFAMQAMPSVMVFCAAVQVLIYLGTVQFVVRSLGKIVAAALDVSAPEATNACANIFLGGIESALLVIEYIEKMPTSRLFALMTNWFASCGGSALIQFITFGVPASYLLAASAMSAPAALVCAKLAYPDNDQSEFENASKVVALEVVTNKNEHGVPERSDSVEKKRVPNGNMAGKLDDTQRHSDEAHDKDDTGRNEQRKRMSKEPNSIGEALVLGTQRGLKLVTNIIGNMIVSLSVVELMDKTVEWFGNRINIHISLKIILSYVFYPFVYLMGVDTADCLRSGEMLGIRTISAPGISYIDLGKLITNRKLLLDYTRTFNETPSYTRDSDIFLPQWNQTLVGGVLSERSEIIVAYALCGFASIPMIGMMIGGLTVLIPDRAPEITKLAFRTLVTGTIASYLTACVAGLVA